MFFFCHTSVLQTGAPGAGHRNGLKNVRSVQAWMFSRRILLPVERPGKDTRPAHAWLIEPSRKILDPARRRKARLLSFFLICLFLLFLSVNLAYLLTIPRYRFPVADLIGYCVLTVTYIISRTRLTAGGLYPAGHVSIERVYEYSLPGRV